MWDQQKRIRFAELRGREETGTLTELERHDLAALTHELLELESSYLEPATQRLQQQRETVEAQNRRLEALVTRRAALAERLQRFLSEAEAEGRAIDGEVDAVLAESHSTGAGG